VRVFVAIDLPPETRARLETLLADLRHMPLRIGWARPEGIHLTLRFLGEVPEGSLEVIAGALERAARAQAPFSLEVAGVGTFPVRGAPRVLWAGVGGETGPMATLKRTIEKNLEAAGFAPDDRGFQPHLTLGRVKGPGRGDWRSIMTLHAEERFGSFEVREIVLFESQLTPAGALYRALRRFPLRGSATA